MNSEKPKCPNCHTPLGIWCRVGSSSQPWRVRCLNFECKTTVCGIGASETAALRDFFDKTKVTA